MRVLAGWFLLLCAPMAIAATPAGQFRQAEASMLVTGRIQVDREGAVSGFSFDQKELPPEASDLLNGAVPRWRFKPVELDGKPVPAATDMSIRLVATKLSGGDYLVAVRSAVFGSRSGKPAERASAIAMAPPPYPHAALAAGVTGTVHVLVKAGRDGSVIDAMVEQVNLSAVPSAGRSAERWRQVLADACLHRVREWKFQPPTEGAQANRESWLLHVPVVFTLGRGGAAAEGQWQVYLPGPRTPNPWEAREEDKAFSPDALPPGGVYLAGSSLHLLSELSGG